MAEIAIEEETEDTVVIVTETIEAMIEASEEEEIMIVDQEETTIELKDASIVKKKDIMLEIAQNVNYFIKIARAPR